MRPTCPCLPTVLCKIVPVLVQLQWYWVICPRFPSPGKEAGLFACVDKIPQRVQLQTKFIKI